MRSRKLWRSFAPVIAAVAMCACAAQGSKPDAAQDGSYIDYRLPVTAAMVNVNLTITSCTPLKASAVVALNPVVRPSPYDEHQFRIRGTDLASFWKKRELKIELYPNNAIKSLNASVADRTGAIITNAIKIVGALAAFDPSAPRPAGAPVCNPATDQAVRDADVLKGRIKALQQQVVNAPAANPEAIRKQIDAVAAEVGRLQADSLTIALTQTIEFGNKEDAAGFVRWKAEDFRKWFKSAGAETIPEWSLAWCVERPKAGQDPTCSADQAKGSEAGTLDARRLEKAVLPECVASKCARTLVFREPRIAALALVTASDAFADIKPDTQLAQATFPMPQWGVMTYFPLDVGFAGSKSLTLTFDEFGRRTSFGWASDAQGEGMTGAAQGILDAAGAYRTARAGEALAAEKAELDALDTQQKLNKLRRCKAVLDAGGFVCPEQ